MTATSARSARSAALEVRDVVTAYGRRTVLRGVSLQTEPGEIVGLIGPNGSGKTTLLRTISRQLRPSGGSVRIAGDDPYALPARRAARLVAVVPQEMVPAFAFSVREVVGMGRSPHRGSWGGEGPDDRAGVRRAMEAADVTDLAERPFLELSAGERQRVTVAQALAQDAPLLLLDEPTVHLDARHVLDLLALVRGLARTTDVSVLAVLHDLNLAGAFCDRLYALSGGEVVASGRPGEVITQELLTGVYGVEAEVLAAPSTGRPTVVMSAGVHGAAGAAPGAAGACAERGPDSGSMVHVIGGAGTGADAMRELREAGFTVTAGVLHATDTDAMVAAGLGLLRVTVPPFSSIDPASAAECLALARRAVAVVLCDAPVGEANVANLRIGLEAAEAGVPVFLLGSPIAGRDFTGGEATVLWEKIAARAGPPSGISSLLRALRSM